MEKSSSIQASLAVEGIQDVVRSPSLTFAAGYSDLEVLAVGVASKARFVEVVLAAADELVDTVVELFPTEVLEVLLAVVEERLVLLLIEELVVDDVILDFDEDELLVEGEELEELVLLDELVEDTFDVRTLEEDEITVLDVDTMVILEDDDDDTNVLVEVDFVVEMLEDDNELEVDCA